MTYLKCTKTNTAAFLRNKHYPIQDSYPEAYWGGVRTIYCIIDEYGSSHTLPLEGMTWCFDLAGPKPRYHRKRKSVPKRTVTVAQIYYNDGSTYTVKHVDKVVCYGGKVMLFGRQCITDGIEDSHLIKIDAGLLRNIVVKSPSQETQIERDFVQGDKWNVYRKTEQIFRAAQIDIEV